jgi:general secretion pathway protein M
MDRLLKFFNLKKMNKRERYAVIAGAAVIFIFIVARLMIYPFFSRTEHLKRSLQVKTTMLAQMRQLQSQYLAVNQKTKLSTARFQQRPKGFTLFSFLDRLAGEAGIKDRISYMKPSRKAEKNSPYKISRVEMKLEAVSLEQLTKYLYAVETSANMVEIKKIAISKKDKKQGLINVVLHVQTVEI